MTRTILWLWMLALAMTGTGALYFIFRHPGRRWLRPIAVTCAGAIVSIVVGGTSALFPILLTGAILAVCSAFAARRQPGP